MKVYLVGYMYSGKTTVGRQLAKALGYKFVDLDQLFESTFHISIPMFFKRYGEKAFRIVETAILHKTASFEDTVIATGGGTPCKPGNMEFINQNGVSVYLELAPEAIISRMTTSKKVRPIFSGLSEQQKIAKVHSHLLERLPFYQQSVITIPAISPDINSLAVKIQSYCLNNSSSKGMDD